MSDVEDTVKATMALPPQWGDDVDRAMTEPTTCAQWAGACQDPVFVLCAGRSGSTLLRFLLDAHPDLACPPETELPTLCTQLASVWSLLRSAEGPVPQPGAAPEPVIDGLRHVLDLMVGPYLAQRGKKRYCDKSLGSARHAALLLRMYPQARFICLYRHPMDVIASGLESCPWGLNSYGFEHYIGGSPTNAVAALGRYWTDHTAAVIGDRHADHRDGLAAHQHRRTAHGNGRGRTHANCHVSHARGR